MNMNIEQYFHIISNGRDLKFNKDIKTRIVYLDLIFNGNLINAENNVSCDNCKNNIINQKCHQRFNINTYICIECIPKILKNNINNILKEKCKCDLLNIIDEYDLKIDIGIDRCDNIGCQELRCLDDHCYLDDNCYFADDNCY